MPYILGDSGLVVEKLAVASFVLFKNRLGGNSFGLALVHIAVVTWREMDWHIYLDVRWLLIEEVGHLPCKNCSSAIW